MVCEYCGNFMEKINSWGDGWSEPREEQWYCHHCSTEVNDNQAYGMEWDFKDNILEEDDEKEVA